MIRWIHLNVVLKIPYLCGRHLGMSRAGRWAMYRRSPGQNTSGAWHWANLGKQGPRPQGNLSSPSISLALWFRPPDTPYRWSCGSDPLLTFPTLACSQSCRRLPWRRNKGPTEEWPHATPMWAPAWHSLEHYPQGHHLRLSWVSAPGPEEEHNQPGEATDNTRASGTN